MAAVPINHGRWEDITGEFMQCVKQLHLGELLKTDQFTLLEAMSAIELMDPKMDGGMMVKKSNRKILTLEQSIKAGTVKVSNLELNELIGIIDDSYSCLVTWLEGHSLAQTVMTNLYLHEPERIEDRCLRVFSQSMLKLVDCMDEMVQTFFCIEEEDFLLNLGKFNLARQINCQKVLSNVEDLCHHYEKLLSEKPTSSSCQDKQQAHENLLLQAIIERLKFTYNFYACFFNLQRVLVKNQWDLDTQTEAQYLKTLKLVQNTVSTCDEKLEKCLKHLDRWKDTIDLGIKPPKQDTDTQNEAEYPTIMGFEPLINHKLLPPAYPRCPSMKTRSSALEYLRNLIIKLRQCFVLSNSFNQRSFSKSLHSIEYFSKYFRPSSCVISRSLIQLLYLPYRSVKLLKEELLQSMSEFCDPLVQVMKEEALRFGALDEFITESKKAFSLVISMYGHNTARQHERFPDLILSFKNLQYSALLINSAFGNSLVYSWITFHLAQMCIKYVLSGLELELFSYHEYPYVFWYLYDILYRNEKEQLEIAKHFIVEFSSALDDKKGKGKKQRRKNMINTNLHDKNLMCNDAFRFLTGGLFLLTYGLKLQGKIKTPVMEYTSEKICFDQRFGILTGASVYQSYKQTLLRLEKLEFIYREALDCFTEAKDLFEKLGDQNDCLKVCKTNMIVARILQSNSSSVTSRDVEFSFDTHPSFPTIKV